MVYLVTTTSEKVKSDAWSALGIVRNALHGVWIT
jgi:hypothetical protein